MLAGRLSGAGDDKRRRWAGLVLGRCYGKFVMLWHARFAILKVQFDRRNVVCDSESPASQQGGSFTLARNALALGGFVSFATFPPSGGASEEGSALNPIKAAELIINLVYGAGLCCLDRTIEAVGGVRGIRWNHRTQWDSANFGAVQRYLKHCT